jgi:hypothetical protein
LPGTRTICGHANAESSSLASGVLVAVALVREVARDDEVARGRVDLLDCGAKQLLAIAAAADVDVRAA